MNRKIVVIGGVAAGATAAAKARRTDENAEITIIEKDKYISYANCGLPYYAGGIIESRSKILLHSKESFGKRFNVDVRLSTEATSINRDAKIVTVRDENGVYDIPYDRLVIAVGGRTLIPPVKGIENVSYFTMRTVGDADSIREYIENKRPKSAAIIGGGFIGIETAESMLHSGLAVSIIEARPEIMPVMPRVIAQDLRVHMEKKGINFFTGLFAKEVTEKNGKITVELSDGKKIETDMLFVCAGVAPDTTLAKSCGLEIGKTGGIAVNETMRTSDKDIFAAGDAVEKVSRVTGKKTLLPLANPANREGRIAGFNAASDGEQMMCPPVVGTSIVGFDGFAVGMTGLSYEQAVQAGIDADYVYTEDADISTYYAPSTYIFMLTVFEKKTGRLLGVAASGVKGVDKRLDMASAALYAGLTVFDLENFETAYAPQFGKAKDNLIIAGFAASNKVRGSGFVVSPEEFLSLIKTESIQVLDVRTKREHDAGCIEGSINIPVDALREKASALNISKPVYIYCAVGFRGYLAVRMLRGMGFEAYNVSGGIESVARVKKIM